MKAIFDPTKHRYALRLLTAGSLLGLGACGGGGGGLASTNFDGIGGTGSIAEGIGGTGYTSSGTVDAVGSIYVNGVRYVLDDAEIFINGEPASDADLGLGMVVTVRGTLDDDENGTAERVDYDPVLEGPVESVELNADGSVARLRIVGQIVLVERTSTVLEDVSFDALAAGDVVEVSGYRDADGSLRATRLELQTASQDSVNISGLIANLDGNQFTIGAQTIDASAANLSNLPDGTLANGLDVDVEGVLQDGVLVADEVTGRGMLADSLEPDDAITVLGTVKDFVGLESFTIDGLPIDAASAVINSGGVNLKNGAIVEVQGTWNGDVLVAETVTSRRGRIELEAPLRDIDGSRLTLEIGNELVTVETDSRTLFDDDRDGIEFLELSDLGTGDFLEVEARLDGNTLLATRVDRDENEDEISLQGPVDSFVTGVSVTILGIRFDLSQSEFEDAGDRSISADVFFANLRPQALLRITDSVPADGFPEVVEFEFANSLDGEQEFLDDDEERIEEEALDDAILDYLAQNFPGASIAFIEIDDDEIEVYLTDGTEVTFDANGEFIESDREDDESDEEDESEEPEEDDEADESEEDGESEESEEDDESDEPEEDDESDEPEEDDESDESEEGDESDEPEEDEEFDESEEDDESEEPGEDGEADELEEDDESEEPEEDDESEEPEGDDETGAA